MTKQPVRFLVIVLLLGGLFDFLFWKRPLGANFAIFLLVCLLTGFALLRSYGITPARRSLWLALPALFFALISFIRQEPLTMGLAYAFALLAAGLLAATYFGGRWMQYSLLDYISKLFQLVGSLFALPSRFIKEADRERIVRGDGSIGHSLGPVFSGLGLAAPVLLVFTILLTSADMVFDKFVTDLFTDQLGANFWRLVWVLICAYTLAGAYLHAAYRSHDERLLGEDKPIIRAFLGFTEAAVVLGSVVALFAIFVLVQFRYFFGGEVNIGVAGFTYSQYARSGFNELVTVACLSLLLTLGLSTITRRASAAQRRTFSALSAAIALLVMVILVSAYQRLSLAIDWHGFSRLRLYPRVFLVWVGILFAVVVILEMLHRERYFAFAALLASLGFAVTLSLVNVDASIVHYNVYRATALGKQLNVNHLTTLSTDAVPALADEFFNPTPPVKVHEGLGAALLCYMHSAPLEAPPEGDLRGWSYSNWNARQSVWRVARQLNNYQVNDDKWLVRVQTPGGDWYDCAQSQQVD